MEVSNSTREVPDRQAYTDSWLRTRVFAFDARLRRRHGVVEYSDRPDCIFRIQHAHNPTELKLSDGTLLRAGDQTIVLHMWNEQFPKMPANGPTLHWARRTKHCLDISLRELARYLRARPQLCDVKAIRVDPNPAGLREFRKYSQVLARYGFETFPSLDPRSPAEWARRLGENVLISMFILSRNPFAFRVDSLWRGRAAAFLSRQLLDQRYGTYYAGRSRP